MRFMLIFSLAVALCAARLTSAQCLTRQAADAALRAADEAALAAAEAALAACQGG